jgi:tetratricopeptide (TPR) repeat protein
MLASDAFDGTLVVVGSGEGLFDGAARAPSLARMRPFTRWGRRFLLSTRQLAAWGSREEALVRSGFSVAPATPAALSAIAGRLEHEPMREDFLAVRRILTEPVAARAAQGSETEGVQAAAATAIDGLWDVSDMPLPEGSDETETQSAANASILARARRSLVLGDLEQAVADYEEARASCSEIGDIPGVAACLIGLGEVSRQRGDLDAARARFSEALSHFQSIGNSLGEAGVERRLGAIMLLRGNDDVALGHYERADDLSRNVGDMQGEARSRFALGDIAARHREYDQARSFYEEAKSRFDSLGDKRGLAHCIRRLGDLDFKISRYQEAAAHIEAAKALFQELGDVGSFARCVRRVGDIAAALDDIAAARESYREAATKFEQVGWREDATETLARLMALERSDAP